MPLQPVPLKSPVDLRGILTSTGVPIRTNDGFALSVDQLFAATPMERRTGAQIARAEMMDKAVNQAQEAKVLIHAPLETERIIGLYFAARWCAVSRNFTPQLMTTYSELKKQNRDFEIVLCSFDNKPEDYVQFVKTMPWPRLPFRDARIKQLAKEFGVRDKDLPKLILIRASDNGLISTDARALIPYDQLGKKFPWHADAPGWFSVAWNGLGSTGRMGAGVVGAWCAWQLLSWTGVRARVFGHASKTDTS